MAHPTKMIVLDDDPTGSQTVHSCLLLTRWDVPTLSMGLADSSPMMFILTNTRALPADQAKRVTQEVCENLKIALLDQLNVPDFLIVSRSDSTLRGHYPIETDAISTVLGPFDAHFLVPAFLEGGRITQGSIHYLKVGDKLMPVHETEFAQDSVFVYRHSYLPDYVAEKTQGRIPAERVERFLLEDIRHGIQPRLAQLAGNACGVVDAETQADLDRFAEDVLAVAATGKRFLFRSAASLLTALAQLPPQPIPAEAMGQYRRSDAPGVIVVGSHVQKTTEQLTCLLGDPRVVGIELAVAKLIDHKDAAPQLIQESLDHITRVFEAGQTPVLFTSRQELQFADATTRLAFGLQVSEVLMAIVRELPPQISFLISKGGITSNDVLSTGLNLRTARLLGQILPGCSVVRTGPDHPRFPGLPVVLFPGNVGDRQGLLTVYERLAGVAPA